MKTEARCFLTVDDVLFVDDATEGVYDGGAMYVGVDEVDVCAAAVLVCDVFVEDMLVMWCLASFLLGSRYDLDSKVWRGDLDATLERSF